MRLQPLPRARRPGARGRCTYLAACRRLAFPIGDPVLVTLRVTRSAFDHSSCDDGAMHSSGEFPPVTRSGEWGALLAAPTMPVGELDRARLPHRSGVYLWRREGKPVYVGTATNLQKRVWGRHLGAGVSLAGSSLRRNVCELLFAIPPNVTGNPTRKKVTGEQAAAIRAWLGDCELSWVECDSAKEAEQLEGRLRAEYLPLLNRI